VICTYHRPASLSAALGSLARLQASPEDRFEVLVVDNGCADATEAAVRGHAGLPGLRYVREPELGLSHARNRGIREAGGRILAFLDDDVVVDPGWLRAICAAFRRYGAACVTGRVLLGDGLRRPTWWHPRFDGPLGKFDRGEGVILSTETTEPMLGIGANLAIRRDVFDRHGLFRGDLGRRGRRLLTGEETELCGRLRENGELIVHDPAALVFHLPDTARFTKAYLRRWYFRIGAWEAQHGPAPAGEPRILGVPRWRYRLALADAGAAVALRCRGRSAEAFHRQIRLIEFLGALSAGAGKRWGRPGA